LLIIRQKAQVAGQVERTNLEFPLQLLGVNAADRSAEGTKFSKEFLSSGSPRIELDRRRLDSAGNFLAYVYVDERTLNEELIRAGFAEADHYPGDNQSMHRDLVKAEKEAKRAGRGKWSTLSTTAAH